MVMAIYIHHDVNSIYIGQYYIYPSITGFFEINMGFIHILQTNHFFL